MTNTDIDNMKKALSYLRENVADMEADIEGFDKRAEEDAHCNVITAHGWCVVTDSLAILVDGDTWLKTVHIEPHLCGFTCMGRADAERVAALRNDVYEEDVRLGTPPWKAVRVDKLAARQAAYLRELKAGVEEAIRETEAYLAEKGVEA